MLKIIVKTTTAITVALLLFSACATSPAGNVSAVEAEAAAMAALAGLRPLWVDNPEAVYPRSRFVSAVGHGNSRDMAERDALARIVAFFGQAVQAELHTVTAFSQAVRDGIIQVTEDTAVQNAITTSAQMETLVGAEIADIWRDAANNIYFAVAIMENERTAILYSDLIRSN